MQVGYARISQSSQKLDLQLDALKEAGCEKIFTDISSGGELERQGLDETLTFLRAGDTLVVWRLDRLGRSIKHLVRTMNRLKERKISFRCLRQNIDTSTPTGKETFRIFALLAEFEREALHERTHAGLQAAKARGRVGGRPTVVTAKVAEKFRQLRADKSLTIEAICRMLKISRMSYYRHIAEA